MNQPDAITGAAERPAETPEATPATGAIPASPTLSAAARLVAASLSKSPISAILLTGVARLVEFAAIAGADEAAIALQMR